MGWRDGLHAVEFFQAALCLFGFGGLGAKASYKILNFADALLLFLKIDLLLSESVGTLAFIVFSAKGKMSHGLNEPIPGEVVTEISAHDGLGRLWTSLEAFRDFNGDMQPHFAYGRLDKAQFGKAHLLHIENHLEEVG